MPLLVRRHSCCCRVCDDTNVVAPIRSVGVLADGATGRSARATNATTAQVPSQQTKMIILGVDPGTATMGYGVLEKTGNRYRALEYGVLATPKTMPPAERLRQLYRGLQALVERYQPDALVTEQLLFSTNRRTAIQVARAAGIAMLVAAEAGIEWHEYTPLQVKQAVTGYGGADKTQVQTMVQRLLGLETLPKPDDAADALAIALCHAHHVAMLTLTRPR